MNQQSVSVHDLSEMDLEWAYDHTQTHDEIKHGDVLLLQDGSVAIMYKAWPVLVFRHDPGWVLDEPVFHELADGGSWEDFKDVRVLDSLLVAWAIACG